MGVETVDGPLKAGGWPVMGEGADSEMGEGTAKGECAALASPLDAGERAGAMSSFLEAIIGGRVGWLCAGGRRISHLIRLSERPSTAEAGR